MICNQNRIETGRGEHQSVYGQDNEMSDSDYDWLYLGVLPENALLRQRLFVKYVKDCTLGMKAKTLSGCKAKRGRF